MKYIVTKVETIEYTTELDADAMRLWLGYTEAEMAENFATATDIEDEMNAFKWPAREAFEEFIEGRGGDVQGGNFRVQIAGA